MPVRALKLKVHSIVQDIHRIVEKQRMPVRALKPVEEQVQWCAKMERQARNLRGFWGSDGEPKDPG